MKEQVLSVIRRLSDQPDGKISFREFSLGITPDPLCLDQPACNTELNSEMKQKMAEAMASYNQPLQTSSSPRTQSLRAFRPIHNDEKSPVKKEFKTIPKWQKDDPDYIENFSAYPQIDGRTHKITYSYQPEESSNKTSKETL